MTLELLDAALAGGDRHFAPFFVLGDPDPELSLKLCMVAVRSGATMLELGLPYSDPVADGPAVSRAGGRAQATTPPAAARLIARLRERTDVPINLLVYANLVHTGGMKLLTSLARAGASSLLVPDVPMEESDGLRDAVVHAGMGFVELCGPATPDQRVERLSQRCTSFLYLAGQQGITGARDRLTSSVTGNIARVQLKSCVPTCVGFGLKRPEHLSAVFDAGARIAIVGSALCETIAQSAHDPELLLERMQHQCSQLARATCEHENEG